MKNILLQILLFITYFNIQCGAAILKDSNGGDGVCHCSLDQSVLFRADSSSFEGEESGLSTSRCIGIHNERRNVILLFNGLITVANSDDVHLVDDNTRTALLAAISHLCRTNVTSATVSKSSLTRASIGQCELVCANTLENIPALKQYRVAVTTPSPFATPLHVRAHVWQRWAVLPRIDLVWSLTTTDVQQSLSAFLTLLNVRSAAPPFADNDAPRRDPQSLSPSELRAICLYFFVELQFGAFQDERKHCATVLHNDARFGSERARSNRAVIGFEAMSEVEYGLELSLDAIVEVESFGSEEGSYMPTNLALHGDAHQWPPSIFNLSVASNVVDGRRVVHTNELYAYARTSSYQNASAYIGVALPMRSVVTRIDLHLPIDMADTYFVGGSAVDWPYLFEHARAFGGGQLLYVDLWQAHGDGSANVGDVCGDSDQNGRDATRLATIILGSRRQFYTIPLRDSNGHRIRLKNVNMVCVHTATSERIVMLSELEVYGNPMSSQLPQCEARCVHGHCRGGKCVCYPDAVGVNCETRLHRDWQYLPPRHFVDKAWYGDVSDIVKQIENDQLNGECESLYRGGNVLDCFFDLQAGLGSSMLKLIAILRQTRAFGLVLPFVTDRWVYANSNQLCNERNEHSFACMLQPWSSCNSSASSLRYNAPLVEPHPLAPLRLDRGSSPNHYAAVSTCERVLGKHDDAIVHGMRADLAGADVRGMDANRGIFRLHAIYAAFIWRLQRSVREAARIRDRLRVVRSDGTLERGAHDVLDSHDRFMVPTVGVHVRLSDACRKGSPRTRRCQSIVPYVVRVRALLDLYGGTQVFLATDDANVAKSMREALPSDVRLVTLDWRRSEMSFAGGKKVEHALGLFNDGKTSRGGGNDVQNDAVDGGELMLSAVADIELLASSAYLVGSSSSLFKLSMLLATHRHGHVPPFALTDGAWCFTWRMCCQRCEDGSSQVC